MKKIILFITLLFAFSLTANAGSLDGRILLQVENNGEAWYVDPVSGFRYYLSRPQEALMLMRYFGLGINNRDLARIQIAVSPVSGPDRDKDGLSDSLEEALGLNAYLRDSDGDGSGDYREIEEGSDPLGPGFPEFDRALASRLAGRILLQVEEKGQAWYVDAVSRRRYFLGRPEDAFFLMQKLGLGASNNDLSRIQRGEIGAYSSVEDDILARLIFRKVNDKRVESGLPALAWNMDLARTAQAHSQALAGENRQTTALNLTCNYPLIHHEGLDGGLYNGDRLRSANIHYFSQAAENIILLSAVRYSVYYQEDDPRRFQIEECDNELSLLDQDFKNRLSQADNRQKPLVIQEEIEQRRYRLSKQSAIEFVNEGEHSRDYLAGQAVAEWLASPGHYQNIMDPEYDESGLGLAEINGYLIATQIFIKRADCGYTSGPCCKESAAYCYSPNRCDLQSNTCY